MTFAPLPRLLAAAAGIGMLSTSAGFASTLVRHAGAAAPQRYHIVAGWGGAHANVTCPPQYTECLSISRGNPSSTPFCISSAGNCSSGLVGIWDWTAVVAKVRGQDYKKISAVWSPDPGNPSTITISTTKRHSRHTRIVATVTLSTCEVTSGSCFSDFAVVAIYN